MSAPLAQAEQLRLFVLDLAPTAEEPSRPPPRREPKRSAELLLLGFSQLPATRFDCVRDREQYAMPCCPYLTCRHHLWHTRAEEFDAMLDKPPAEWPHTCSLDVADAVALSFPGTKVPGLGHIDNHHDSVKRGCLRKLDVGRHLGISGERARQLEVQALEHMRQRPVMAEVEGKVDCAVDWFGGL